MLIGSLTLEWKQPRDVYMTKVIGIGSAGQSARSVLYNLGM